MKEDELLKYAWDLLSKLFWSIPSEWSDASPEMRMEFQLIMANIVTEACTVPD